MNRNFEVFILTHGRPNNVKTYKTLIRQGYTGPIKFIVDNEDSTVAEYQKNFGKENVVIFDKLKQSNKFDTYDTSDNRKTIVYARNFCFDYAKENNIDYFLELDDDYDKISYRKEIDGMLTQRINVKNLDRLFNLMIDFLDVTKAKTVALAQGGDFIGGLNSRVWKEQLSRKAMNSFFCKTDNAFTFLGRINEDVNTYTTLGSRGDLFLSIANVMINQAQTQKNESGMTDIYLDNGTYVKSFYSIISSPSSIKIGLMGDNAKRIHHKIKWNNTVPKIINQKYKKR